MGASFPDHAHGAMVWALLEELQIELAGRLSCRRRGAGAVGAVASGRVLHMERTQVHITAKRNNIERVRCLARRRMKHERHHVARFQFLESTKLLGGAPIGRKRMGSHRRHHGAFISKKHHLAVLRQHELSLRVETHRPHTALLSEHFGCHLC